MTVVEGVAEDQWRLLKAARLAALADTPNAFGRTLREEERLTDADWKSHCWNGTWYVASEKGEPCGLVAGTFFGAHPELTSMWVAASHRGTGLAEQFVASVVDWARGEGADELRLTVTVDNGRAERFYQRLVLRPLGVIEPMPNRPGTMVHELGMSL